ncbi:MAG: hypothetical protein AAFV19_18285 [Pseudomonadota bacterium]
MALVANATGGQIQRIDTHDQTGSKRADVSDLSEVLPSCDALGFSSGAHRIRLKEENSDKTVDLILPGNSEHHPAHPPYKGTFRSVSVLFDAADYTPLTDLRKPLAVHVIMRTSDYKDNPFERLAARQAHPRFQKELRSRTKEAAKGIKTNGRIDLSIIYENQNPDRLKNIAACYRPDRFDVKDPLYASCRMWIDSPGLFTSIWFRHVNLHLLDAIQERVEHYVNCARTNPEDQ